MIILLQDNLLELKLYFAIVHPLEEWFNLIQYQQCNHVDIGLRLLHILLKNGLTQYNINDGTMRTLVWGYFCFLEESSSFQELFLRWKTLFPSQSYRILKSRKCILTSYSYIACANFNRDSPKYNFNVCLLLQFW